VVIFIADNLISSLGGVEKKNDKNTLHETLMSQARQGNIKKQNLDIFKFVHQQKKSHSIQKKEQWLFMMMMMVAWNAVNSITIKFVLLWSVKNTCCGLPF
jgi:hypothetical protein